jgi:hypothetical protein
VLYGVIPVRSSLLFAFAPEDGAKPFDLTTMVLGPDDVPYVLDKTTKTVFRIDLKRKKATAVLRAGREVGNLKVAEPMFLAEGGRDLLVLDAKNVLWRWRASNDAGKGTPSKVNVFGSSQWGDDVTAIGTYLKDDSRGLYNLYVTDPSEEQIRAYSPAADGSGFPVKATGWLAAARAVDKMRSMYIDGDIFVAEDGVLERFTSGKNDGWEVTPPGDDLLREAPVVSLLAGAGDRRSGTIYAYDKPNARIVAWDKASGDYVGQYRPVGGPKEWQDLRGMYVIPGIEDGPATLVWLTKGGVHQALLEAATGSEAGPGASGGPSATPSGSADPEATAKPSPKP